jgi:hypothetical protein
MRRHNREDLAASRRYGPPYPSHGVPDEPLAGRWPGPLGLVLYGVLVADRPHLDSTAIVSEIRIEVGYPSQQVRAIQPDVRADEADLRQFLARVADELDRGAQLPGELR